MQGLLYIMDEKVCPIMLCVANPKENEASSFLENKHIHLIFDNTFYRNFYFDL